MNVDNIKRFFLFFIRIMWGEFFIFSLNLEDSACPLFEERNHLIFFDFIFLFAFIYWRWK